MSIKFKVESDGTSKGTHVYLGDVTRVEDLGSRNEVFGVQSVYLKLSSAPGLRINILLESETFAFSHPDSENTHYFVR